MRLFILAALLLTTTAHTAELTGEAQSIMDVVLAVLRPLMDLTVEFIRLVLAELVNALKQILPDFGLGK